MHKHRYFYIENGQRKEELIDGKWVPIQADTGHKGHLLIRDHLGDGVKGVYNPATRQTYDSRSRYLADTRAAGCEVVGNDQPMTPPRRAKVQESFAQTVERLNQQNRWNL